MPRSPARLDLAHRALAVIGGAAHAVDRPVRWPLRRIGLGFVPGALLAGVLVLGLAASTAVANLEAYGERPAPTHTTLGAIGQGTVSSGLWVEFDALLVNEPHRALVPIFDNGVQVDEVVRHYYLARNPRGPEEALVVRSPLDPDRAVLRTVRATVAREPAALAERDAFGNHDAGVTVDEGILLDEVDATPGPGEASPEDVLAPSDLSASEEGASVTVRGRVVAQAPGAGGEHLYLFADPAGSRAVVLRSPHPPDALPVRLDGTLVTDPFNVENVLTDWRPEERFGELEISDRRLLALGASPAFAEPSWWGFAALTLLGLLLVAGAALPHPVFRASREHAPGAASGALPPGRAAGEIPVRVHGRLPTPHGPVVLDDVAGKLEWLPVAEVARIRWRYWGAQLGDFRRDVEEAVRAAGEETEQLVLHSPVESVLWAVPAGGRTVAEAGSVYRWLRRVPGLRLHHDGADAYLAFADAAARDRALAAVRAAA